METVRAFFAKGGRLKYISHLDVTRCLSRVFSRCGLPIWYTQGFNPHPYLTFALPLPLGVDSSVESFDFRLTEPVDYETVKERLNAALPPDLQVIRVAAPVMKPDAICWADYRIAFHDDMPQIAEQLDAFLAQDEILVTKKTKKGEQQVNLKQMLTLLSQKREEDAAVLTLRLPAGSTFNVSPLLFTAAFTDFCGEEARWTSIRRLGVLTENFSDFM